MKLYLALIRNKEISRLEFDWLPIDKAMAFVRHVIREELGSDWIGTVIIDNEPIFSGADDFMFFGETVPSSDGSIDFKGRILAWKYPPGHNPD